VEQEKSRRVRNIRNPIQVANKKPGKFYRVSQQGAFSFLVDNEFIA